jgi:predicted PurR-regulated permease PerM
MPEATASRFLNDSQRRVIGFSLTLLALLAAGALLILTFIALARLAGYFSGVLWPLACAGVLALILRPMVELLEARLRIRRVFAVVVLYGAFLLMVTGALVLILPTLIDQLIAFIAYLPVFWQSASLYVERNYPGWIALGQRQLANPAVQQVVDNLSGEFKGVISQALPSLRAAGGSVLGVFAFAAQLAIIPIYLFFFLLSRSEPTRHLEQHLSFLGGSTRPDIIFLVREFIGIVVSFFRGQLLIGLLMGVLLAIGFSIVGLKFGLFIGLTLGLLNIVPYLGTILGLILTLPLAFFQPEGGWHLMGLVLLVCIVVQNIEGWFLTPKIMGARTGLHPLTIIVAIFFWGTAFDGVLGMLFAIPLTAFFVTLWRLLRRKYFNAAAAG